MGAATALAPTVVSVSVVGAESTTVAGATVADRGMVYVDPAASTNTDAAETSVADGPVPVAEPGDESTTRGATSPLEVGITNGFTGENVNCPYSCPPIGVEHDACWADIAMNPIRLVHGAEATAHVETHHQRL